MRMVSTALVTGLLALAGCGGNDEPGAPKDRPPKEDAAMKHDGVAMKKDGPTMAAGTTLTVGDSEFGRMLFDSNKQAIYIFENDPKGESACYGERAEAWPPVFAKGKLKAGDGVKDSLLDTVKRRDGIATDLRGQAALLLRPRGAGRGALPQRGPQRRAVVGCRARREQAAMRRLFLATRGDRDRRGGEAGGQRAARSQEGVPRGAVRGCRTVLDAMSTLETDHKEVDP